MKAQELRLGNYVLDSGGKVLRIDFFEHLQSGYDCKFGQRMFLASEEVHPMTDYTNSAKPIPLTEQWFIDFGFEKFGDNSSFYLGCYENGFIFDRYDSTQARIWWRGRYMGICQRLEYVHQLQNLYFALTGEELQL